MNKTIYEEAIKVVTYLQEQNSHLKDNCGTIYVSTENIATLENLLTHSHKQEKLLELYRQLVKDLGLVIEHDTTDTWDGPEDYEYLEVNNDSEKSLNTYKQIKEIENE